MGVKLERRKKRNWLLSVVYRLSRLRPTASPETRLRVLLDLEWIFERLALEESFHVFEPRKHPVRTSSLEFWGRRLLPTDRVLDLGCNKGEMTALLAGFCREVVGIDTDAAAIAIAIAGNYAHNVSFVHGDGVAYFDAHVGRFDVVVVSHLIEHLDDPRPLLQAAARACRSVYVEVPDFERSLSNAYRHLLGSDLIYSDPDHVWEFDRRELRELVADCGLRVAEEQTSHGVIRMWCDGMSVSGPGPGGDRRAAQ